MMVESLIKLSRRGAEAQSRPICSHGFARMNTETQASNACPAVFHPWPLFCLPSLCASAPLREIICSLMFVFSAVAGAQDVIPHHQDQPPGPALSPAQAIAKM